ncbi:MAG: RsmF rRNA methyltransferase first C-terminal domain-containing protein [Candidatus Limiplasma sp.]|nr:RsmF rRNA methyltransferase first C-terminal domain-containing protein [Candidatus Limiplasma sp.]
MTRATRRPRQQTAAALDATPPLPQAFCRRMEAQLGPDAPAYFAALEQPPVRGLRINPGKPTLIPLSALINGLGDPLPWAPDGFALQLESKAGLHPLHEAGAYYLQEPSAMIPATLLAAQPGETVLDLCAAPGGKSTQLAAAMCGQGTLVCNEPVPSRAQTLSRNLERMGVPNALVVSADPERLAALWPQLFDAVLVDAPCSGEGMFRRHPEARLEWDEDAPERCALRQRHILESACRMLRPGGRLCYSTCTMNPEENERTVAALRAAHPELEPIAFSVPVGHGLTLSSTEGCLQTYPHTVSGEGHFTALLRKIAPGAQDGPAAAALLPAAQALATPSRDACAAYALFMQAQAEASQLYTDGSGCADPLPYANAAFGETLLHAPLLPPVTGVRVLRAGLALGQAKGRIWVPDHALALAAPGLALARYPLSEAEARLYHRGETLPVPETLHGYGAVTLAGVALGFAKAGDGQLKNHYPKGLRRP